MSIFRKFFKWLLAEEKPRDPKAAQPGTSSPAPVAPSPSLPDAPAPTPPDSVPDVPPPFHRNLPAEPEPCLVRPAQIVDTIPEPQVVPQSKPEDPPALVQPVQPTPSQAAPTKIQSPQTPTVDLHVGIDLGTSCTKICIGDAYLGTQNAVEFDSAARGVSKFLFPTRFYEAASSISLKPDAAAKVCGNLKLNLMDSLVAGRNIEAAETDLAIYLALVLAYTYAWYGKNLASKHRGRQLCWWLNVGFPAKRIDALPRLSASYTRACCAAIRLVEARAPLSRAAAQECLSSSGEPSSVWIPPDRIRLYPEIAAQLASYVLSPYKQYGPLLLLDIGAGTLDCSTLIIHKGDGDEVCSFHFCAVELLGAFRYVQHTSEILRSVQPDIVRLPVSANHDSLSRHPSLLRDFLIPGASPTPSLITAFSSAQSSFAKDCLNQSHKSFGCFKAYLDSTYRQINPGKKPPDFRQTVNFVLSGGGSRVQFYRDLYPHQLEERLLNLTSWDLDNRRRRAHGQGLHRIHFPTPKTFRAPGLLSEDFDRLSVAHGLSLGAESLMRITAKEASDSQWGDGTTPF